MFDKRIILTFIPILLCKVYVVNGFPSGAPAEACESASPERGHGTSSQPPDYAPFLIIQHSYTYNPGDKINVEIKQLDPKINFKGFLVQALDARTNEFIGEFITGEGMQAMKECSGVTHSNPKPKKSAQLLWQAPHDRSGEVKFRGTIVIKKDTFFANIQAKTIAQQPPYSQPQEYPPPQPSPYQPQSHPQPPPQAYAPPPPPPQVYQPQNHIYSPQPQAYAQESYAPPQQMYSPQQTYTQPQVYSQQQTYVPPQQTYIPPQTYSQQQSYAQPQQNYAQPQQNYAQPQQNYAQPQQSYTQQQTYVQPQQMYQPQTQSQVQSLTQPVQTHTVQIQHYAPQYSQQPQYNSESPQQYVAPQQYAAPQQYVPSQLYPPPQMKHYNPPLQDHLSYVPDPGLANDPSQTYDQGTNYAPIATSQQYLLKYVVQPQEYFSEEPEQQFSSTNAHQQIDGPQK